ncbi:MAG: lysine exporter LysO family protein, partial [Paramuribaculum sp.]|nr:lysine exporter LysO family protein [Paramuribaculum sp.]
QLGTVALLANIFRELTTLVGAPLIRRWLGPEAVISSAGVTSVDVCLPAIRRWCGSSYIPSAIIHGVLIDISTPFFISFFCSI